MPLVAEKRQTVDDEVTPKGDNLVPRKKYDVSKFIRLKLKIFYASQTGKAKGFASTLLDEAVKKGFETEMTDLKTYDPEDDLADIVSTV